VEKAWDRYWDHYQNFYRLPLKSMLVWGLSALPIAIAGRLAFGHLGHNFFIGVPFYFVAMFGGRLLYALHKLEQERRLSRMRQIVQAAAVRVKGLLQQGGVASYRHGAVDISEPRRENLHNLKRIADSPYVEPKARQTILEYCAAEEELAQYEKSNA